jgi:homoserine acetyltransferase
MYAFWHDGQPSSSLAEGAVVGPGRLIDTQAFYVVFVDGLGLWGASKPSAGLGPRFPAYSYFDMAQAIRRLLRDHLRVAHVKLAAGVSLGATQAYLLAAMHPDFVEAILPIGGPTVSDAADPAAHATLALAKAAIEADPVWMATAGAYYDRPKAEHPRQGVMFSWSLLGLSAADPRQRAQQPWATVQQEVFAWAPEGEMGANLAARAQDFDAVDLHHRLRAGLGFSLTKDLGRIRARTLILQVENDRWVSLAAARATAERIPGAMLLSFPHPLAHFASFAAPNVFAEVVRAFVENRFLPQPAAAVHR